VRQRGDARTPHPLQRGVARQLEPQAVDVVRVLTHQQRRVAGFYATGDQLVAGQVRMGAGKAITFKPVVCAYLHPHHAPVADGVRAVGDLASGHRHMQDEER
jgi:hypothetical protein